MAESSIQVSVWLPEREFSDWNRAALRGKTDLPNWVRDVVIHHLTAPAPRPRTRSEREGRIALHWLEEDLPIACEYCGFDLDFTATRRKRFCSDACRVKAWRLRRRQLVATSRR